MQQDFSHLPSGQSWQDEYGSHLTCQQLAIAFPGTVLAVAVSGGLQTRALVVILFFAWATNKSHGYS